MNRLLQLMGCLLLLLAPLSLSAQITEEEKISGIFSNLPFEDFVGEVENKSAYRFYYLQADVDSLLINVHAYQNTLGEILEVLFSGSDLHYSIDSQQRVFITRGKALSLDFSPGYFTIEKESANELAEKPPINAQQERTFAKNRLWEIGQRGSAGSQGTLIGKVLSVDSKEPIIGAIIYARDRPERTITSESGEYSITLPK